MCNSRLLTITKKEFFEHFEEESFFREYGNPVRLADDDINIIVMSYELYSRLKQIAQQQDDTVST